MLIIEEIKKSLDAGNAVELELIAERNIVNELYLSELEKLEVGYVNINKCGLRDGIYIKDDNGHVRNSNFFISKEELQYLYIKRPTPTFDDLIDVVSQALKDRIEFGNVELHQGGLNFENFHDDAIYPQDQYGIEKTIDWINSLYTETFVIESEEDIKKIDLSTAEIEYQNGFKTKIKARNPQDNTLLYKYDKGGSAIKVSINELKGATVTQKRCAA